MENVMMHILVYYMNSYTNGEFYRTGSPFGRQVAVYVPGPTVCTIKNTLRRCVEFLS